MLSLKYFRFYKSPKLDEYSSLKQIYSLESFKAKDFMKRNISIIKAVVTTSIFVFVSCAYSADKDVTNFNEVSRQAAIMLQNRHYLREDFDEKMSARIFDKFIESIDPSRVYFFQSDIDGFSKKYRSSLHEAIIARKSIDIAEEIFGVMRKRIDEREKEVTDLLTKNAFTFDSDRKIIRDRKKVEWPKNQAEMVEVWSNMVEGYLLSEDLRRSNIAKLAEEQGKKNPLANERPAIESVRLKFKRDFAELRDFDNEEVANFMISALGAAYCPHTDYFSAREMEQFESNISAKLVGIGAMLQPTDDGATKISGIVINGPSDKQGQLQLDDRIIGVDHMNDGNMVDIMFMPLDKVVEMIRGKEGTNVKLRIEPAKNPAEISEIVIARDSVEMKGDKAKGNIIDMTKDGEKRRIGVITLPSFYADFGDSDGAHSARDVEKILVRMVGEGITGLLFDLRGNGGGSLDEVRKMTGLFIGSGPVVTVRDYRDQKKTYSSESVAPIYTGPLVVSIDKTSASASEILAGALQDYNRAVVVGDYSSYGKGTVQQPFDLRPWLPAMAGRERAGFLKPTIQKFYRVAGSSTQNKGVESDIILPSLFGGLEVGEKYMDYALEHDQIAPAQGLKPFDRSKLFIPQLQALSKQRVKESIDFQYMIEDTERLEQKVAENSISLDKVVRLKEIEETDTRTKARNKERIERFKKIQQQDVETMAVYRLELDDLDDKDLTKIDITDIKDTHMRLSKSDIEDLDQTPPWPSQMSALQREGMSILSDLVTLTNEAKVKKVVQE
jgi:carboxyl-terminal processing protease